MMDQIDECMAKVMDYYLKYNFILDPKSEVEPELDRVCEKNPVFNRSYDIYKAKIISGHILFNNMQEFFKLRNNLAEVLKSKTTLATSVLYSELVEFFNTIVYVSFKEHQDALTIFLSSMMRS